MATYPLSSQKQLWRLLEAFRRGERLSTLSALLTYRCGALSQRCGDLRALGWDIRSESVPNEEGGYHFEYWLSLETLAQNPQHPVSECAIGIGQSQ